MIALVATAASDPAEAHLVSTGIAPVYDGIVHFALTAGSVLPVMALALYAGLRGAPTARGVLFTLPPSLFVGLYLGALTPAPLSGALDAGATAVSFLVLGVLLAADLHLPSMVITVIAGLLGLIRGGLDGVALASDGLGMSALFGEAVACFVLTALLSAGVLCLQVHWARIGVRVAGSWLSALGLLLIGWMVRGMAP
jgi:hypothetical protein